MVTAHTVRWQIAAPWLHDAGEAWRLTKFVPNGDGDLEFAVTPAAYAHNRSRQLSGIRDWRDYFQHGFATWRDAARIGRPHGIITAFPQLPAIIGICKRLSFSHTPVVAWTFNLGSIHSGLRHRLSRPALATIDRFVVHSRAEITAYSEWLDLPPERFQFVPFETPVRTVEREEDHDHPFVLSMGSAQRDYKLLFDVLADLGYPTVVVAGVHATSGLSAPPNVTLRSGLPLEECLNLVQRARFSVIPVANRTTASGQVTMLDAMMYARPVIITSGPASDDYITPRREWPAGPAWRPRRPAPRHAVPVGGYGSSGQAWYQCAQDRPAAVLRRGHRAGSGPDTARGRPLNGPCTAMVPLRSAAHCAGHSRRVIFGALTDVPIV